MKEEMLHSFFDMIPAKQAVKIGANIVVSSVQHVACIESVGKQKPAKHFEFWNGFGLPKPFEPLMGLYNPEDKGVIGRGLECLGSPSTNPLIF